jgi:hypothetical protein
LLKNKPTRGGKLELHRETLQNLRLKTGPRTGAGTDRCSFMGCASRREPSACHKDSACGGCSRMGSNCDC